MTTPSLEDRLFEQRLEEAAGRGPRPDLEERIAKAVHRAETRSSRRRVWRRSSLLAASMLFAVGVVVAVAVMREDGSGSGAGQPVDPPRGPVQRGPDARGQDPRPQVPPGVLVQRLADTEARPVVARQLVALGGRAVPALAKCLSDPAAPRRAALEVLDQLGRAAVPALSQVRSLMISGPASQAELVAAIRAAGTVTPFADASVRAQVSSAIVLLTMESAGPAVGGPQRLHASQEGTIGFARFLHRCFVAAGEPAQWLDHLRSESPFTRAFAAELVAERGRRRDAAALAVALDAPIPPTVKASWEGVASSGIFTARHDAAKECRSTISRALLRLDASSVPAHAWLLHEGRPAERRRAAMYLVQAAPPESECARVAAAIRFALDEQDAVVLRELVPLIGIALGDTPDARLRLEELSKHGDPQVAARARAALRSRR